MKLVVILERMPFSGEHMHTLFTNTILRFLIHLSNTLFLLSNTLLPTEANIALMLAYLAFAGYDLYKQKPRDESITRDFKFSILLGLLIAFLFFSFLLANGPHTIPNWDYYKYNFLMNEISKDILHPSLQLNGITYPLAYYYAIYLPAVYLAKLIGLFTTVDIFVIQLCFHFWFALMVFLVLSSIAFLAGSRRYLLLLFLFLLGGLDGLGVLLNNSITGNLLTDLQHGGNNGYFVPIRLQCLTSYLFWLPGHTLAALIAFRSFLELKEEGNDYLYSPFHLVSIVLFILSTSIFAFLAYCFFVSFFILLNFKKMEFRWRPLIPFILVLLFMMQFYSRHKLIGGVGVLVFLSFHMKEFGILKYFEWMAQELLIFVFLGLAFKVRDLLYWISFLYIIIVSLIAGNDLLMSSSIMLIVYMLYTLHQKFDHKSKPALAALILGSALYIPSMISNVAERLDLTNAYPNQMPVKEAMKELPDLYYHYVRRPEGGIPLHKLQENMFKKH